MTALLFHRKKTYGDYLAEYIGHVEAGELSFVPWVYCALAQGTDKQKEAAAQTLAEVLAEQGRLQVSGLGVFSTAWRAPRTARARRLRRMRKVPKDLVHTLSLPGWHTSIDYRQAVGIC